MAPLQYRHLLQFGNPTNSSLRSDNSADLRRQKWGLPNYDWLRFGKDEIPVGLEVCEWECVRPAFVGICQANFFAAVSVDLAIGALVRPRPGRHRRFCRGDPTPTCDPAG